MADEKFGLNEAARAQTEVRGDSVRGSFYVFPWRGMFCVARAGWYTLEPRFAEKRTAEVFAAWCATHFETSNVLEPSEALDVADRLVKFLRLYRDADLGVTLSPMELAEAFRAGAANVETSSKEEGV